MSFLRFVFTSAVIFTALSVQAQFQNYTKEIYKEAINSGKPMVLYFHASWCPVCRKQKPLLNEILQEKRYEKFTSLIVDYDKETEIKSDLKVSTQATVVIFKSGKELIRKTGVTKKDELRKTIDMGL